MTTGYLVDTDWAIHYLNGHPEIVEKLQLLKKDGLRLSVVSLAELYEGVYYSRNPEESEAKLNALKPLCLYMHVGERDLEWQMPMQRQSDLLRENGFHVRFSIEPDQGHGIQTLTGDGAGRLFEQLEACKL